MSKIDELIQELCPGGVKWRQLGEICVSLKKGTLKQGELLLDGAYPVINSGREWYGFYNSYNNESNAFIIAARGEYAGFVSYISTKFWAGGLCYPYRSIKEDIILTKFIYYYLKNTEQSIMDVLVARGSIPAINKSDVDKIHIPLPPLKIQEEIVGILDNFTKLEAELEAELEARKKQYEYYRNQLLTPIEIDGKWFMNNEEIDYYQLGDLVDLTTGKLNANAMDENGLYPFFTCAEMPYRINKFAFDTEAILISGNGSQVGHINHYCGKFNAYQRTYILHGFSVKIVVQYLFYYLKGHLKSYILSNVKEGSVPYITLPMLQLFKVPLPNLDEQKRIVSMLSKFDALVNDISIGLPAEIAARRKQYEYYRNKLLSFKNKAESQEA